MKDRIAELKVGDVISVARLNAVTFENPIDVRITELNRNSAVFSPSIYLKGDVNYKKDNKGEIILSSMFDSMNLKSNENVWMKKENDQFTFFEDMESVFSLIEEMKSKTESHTKSDDVANPNHYTSGMIETIEIIKEVTNGYKDGFLALCIGNVQKYIARAPHKHETPLQDIEKAHQYLTFAIDYMKSNPDFE